MLRTILPVIFAPLVKHRGYRQTSTSAPLPHQILESPNLRNRTPRDTTPAIVDLHRHSIATSLSLRTSHRKRGLEGTQALNHGAGLVTQRKRPSIHAQDKRQSYLLSECPPARRFSDTEQAHSYASAWYTSLPLFVWNSALRQELRRRPPISVHHHRPFCPDAAPSPPRPGPAPLPSQPDPYCLLTFHQNLIIIGLPGGERCWSIIEIGHRAKQVTSFETQHEYIFRIGDLNAGTKGATELGCTRMFARLNCYSLSTFSLARASERGDVPRHLSTWAGVPTPSWTTTPCGNFRRLCLPARRGCLA